VLGTLKRHFRDLTWDSNVSRRMKDRFLEVRLATNELESRHGTAPTIDQLASYLHRDVRDIVEALDAGDARRGVRLIPEALDAALRLPDGALRAESQIVVRQVIRTVLETVSKRDRRIFFLRVYAEYTQTEIAFDAGITQAQVSRVLAKLIDRMGSALLQQDPPLLHRE
jgi:RNA polymerase sigma-B factor